MNARAHAPDPSPPAPGLPDGQVARDPQELAAVERTMWRLAHGGQVDKAGGMALEQLSGSGRRLRARLALWAARAFSVESEAAIRWAAAVELLHNATLVHDDIQDGDRTRRGVPTLWVKHGVAQAINAGDLLLMLPFLAIGEIESACRAELSRVLAEHATRTVRGQVEELGLLGAGRLDPDSYVHASAGKTGALLALPVVGAAILAGRDRDTVRALDDVFTNLGVLFQVQDDIVDLFGDKGRGLRGGDIYEGKVSALVVLQLHAAPETKVELLRILGEPRETTTESDVERACEMFETSGALADALRLVDGLHERIRSSAVLASEPLLARVAEQLIELALAPIAHLPRPSSPQVVAS
ncbi:MAG TPA: polyprenyl synthetase family protein [Polyangiaceae bacterium]|nr:polyprenyl synthetase family protein [Polyangiaceae bacterium]